MEPIRTYWEDPESGLTCRAMPRDPGAPRRLRGTTRHRPELMLGSDSNEYRAKWEGTEDDEG